MQDPPDPITVIDRDLDRNVVLLRPSPTEKLKKYIIESGILSKYSGTMDLHNLTPLYQSKCLRHSTIIFCKNSMKYRKILKYKFDDKEGQVQRVQCSCCEYDKKKTGTYFHGETEFKGNFRMISDAIRAVRGAEVEVKDSVDEESRNFLWLQPAYSDICLRTNNVVVFAFVYPESLHLQALNFHPDTQKFSESTCDCQKCTTINHSYNLFDHGSQGIGYQRTHRDRHGLPLIALTITWNDQNQGAHEIFCDKQGLIGKYKFNNELNCFDQLELLEVRVHCNSEESLTKRFQLLIDDGLRLYYSDYCNEISRPFYYGYHEEDRRTQKYTFNFVTHQFEMFDCNFCKFDRAKIAYEKGPIIGISALTNAKISLRRLKGGGVEKRIKKKDGFFVTMEKSPIKNWLGWSPKRIKEDYQSNMLEVHRSLRYQLIEANGVEKWIMSGSLGKSSWISIGMDGQVRPYVKEFGHLEAEKLNVKSAKKRGNELCEEKMDNDPPAPRLPYMFELDNAIDTSEVIFHEHNWCPHYNHTILFAEYKEVQTQFLLTNQYLIQIHCKICQPADAIPLSNGAHFAYESKYSYKLEDRKDEKTIVQKMRINKDSKAWEVVSNLPIRFYKGSHVWSDPSKPCGCCEKWLRGEAKWKRERRKEKRRKAKEPPKKLEPVLNIRSFSPDELRECAGCCGERQSLTELVRMAVEQHSLQLKEERRKQAEKEERLRKMQLEDEQKQWELMRKLLDVPVVKHKILRDSEDLRILTLDEVANFDDSKPESTNVSIQKKSIQCIVEENKRTSNFLKKLGEKAVKRGSEPEDATNASFNDRWKQENYFTTSESSRIPVQKPNGVGNSSLSNTGVFYVLDKDSGTREMEANLNDVETSSESQTSENCTASPTMNSVNEEFGTLTIHLDAISTSEDDSEENKSKSPSSIQSDDSYVNVGDLRFSDSDSEDVKSDQNAKMEENQNPDVQEESDSEDSKSMSSDEVRSNDGSGYSMMDDAEEVKSEI